jgi:hypothetical protein
LKARPAPEVESEMRPAEAAAAPQPPREPPTGDNAEGVRIAGQLLGAATGARWPMYLRNAKQILRAASFDERKYGFGGLIDLLRACQREGFVRLERDRRGGLRLFQGAALVWSGAAQQPQMAGQDVGEPGDEMVMQEIETVEVVVAPEPADEPDVIEVQPVAVVDTTAELLGRAKARPRRARTTSGTAVAAAAARASRTGQRKTAAKKPSGGRRSRKQPPDDGV